MRILKAFLVSQPENAIKLYQEAVKMVPSDATYVKKIGQALVRTHQYDKARSLQISVYS